MSRTGGPGPVYAAVPGDERALVAPMTQLRQHAEFGTGNRGATSAVLQAGMSEDCIPEAESMTRPDW
jgi:hypothetical protein